MGKYLIHIKLVCRLFLMMMWLTSNACFVMNKGGQATSGEETFDKKASEGAVIIEPNVDSISHEDLTKSNLPEEPIRMVEPKKTSAKKKSVQKANLTKKDTIAVTPKPVTVTNTLNGNDPEKGQDKKKKRKTNTIREHVLQDGEKKILVSDKLPEEPLEKVVAKKEVVALKPHIAKDIHVDTLKNNFDQALAFYKKGQPDNVIKFISKSGNCLFQLRNAQYQDIVRSDTDLVFKVYKLIIKSYQDIDKDGMANGAIRELASLYQATYKDEAEIKRKLKEISLSYYVKKK